MSDYRYPFITAKEPAEKLLQIESYLRQLVDKLNVDAQPTHTSTYIPGKPQTASQKKKTDAEATFDEIKSLIIKSADIVDVLYEKYSKKLSGMYVAQSEFGQYEEYTNTQLEQTSNSLSATVESLEALTAENGEFQTQINQQITEIAQSAASISLQVTDILNNGVDKVVTSTGYTFDADGLKIQRAGQTIESLLNNNGLYVTRSGEVMLQADASGVVATDVTVRNYLIIGTHARFEDYPTGRTACFYLD